MNAPLSTPVLHPYPPFRAHMMQMYHQGRQNFYEKVDNGSNWLTAIMSTAVFVQVLPLVGLNPVIPAAVGATTALLKLVYRYQTRAHRHQLLFKRYSDALHDMSDENFLNHNVVLKWNKVLAAITADEPAPMYAALAYAYKEALQSYAEYKGQEPYELHWHQRYLRHVVSFSSTEFRRRERSGR
jgi:hypothetical protein